MKNYTLTLLLTTAPLFAGAPAPVAPAPVAPAPQLTSEQGWTLGLEVSALRPFQSEGSYDDSDFDVGYRGSLGYQTSDGLFVKAGYFGYSTETDRETYYSNEEEEYSYTEDLDIQYVDLVVGQIFRPMEKLGLAPYVGLRWASFQEDMGDVDFDGYGIVLGIDATRALGGNFSLFATGKQSVLFGEDDGNNSDYTTALVSELGLGVQYDFAFGSVVGNVRGGIEGQYWSGVSSEDSEDTGLAGFTLGVNFRF